jgi:hypothetical protein
MGNRPRRQKTGLDHAALEHAKRDPRVIEAFDLWHRTRACYEATWKPDLTEEEEDGRRWLAGHLLRVYRRACRRLVTAMHDYQARRLPPYAPVDDEPLPF